MIFKHVFMRLFRFHKGRQLFQVLAIIHTIFFLIMIFSITFCFRFGFLSVADGTIDFSRKMDPLHQKTI